jgi:hypothetical protein
MSKICDLQTGIGRLQRETKRLQDAWDETKIHWDDKASREFEEKYLQPLLPLLQASTSAVHEYHEIVLEAEKECGDEQRG